MIKHLPWDSDFFNLNIASVDASEEVSDIDLQQFDMFYSFHSDDDKTHKNFKATFQENKIIFEKQLEQVADTDADIRSVDENFEDISTLQNLGYESGKYSRFKLDGNFAERQFKKLYDLWIINSLNRQFADAVLVIYQQDKIAGFVTYKINSTIATIGLIAVLPEFQGQGLGSKLLQRVEWQLFENNIEKLQIPTQEKNLDACSFYTKKGYSILSITPITHYWKNDTI